jgi:hypothetical protein
MITKNTWIFAGRFDDHVDAVVRSGAHCLMKHIQGPEQRHPQAAPPSSNMSIGLGNQLTNSSR